MSPSYSSSQDFDGQILFFTLVNSDKEEVRARLMIASLRAFGGRLSSSPVWVYYPWHYRPYPDTAPGIVRDFESVHCFPLVVPEGIQHYVFADKVSACAQAEEMAGPEVSSLVWLNAGCLVVNPPTLFDLGSSHDAAFRPVHVQNIGSTAGAPLDHYWQRIYQMVGLVDDAPFAVESFVDEQVLRPYLNSHCFSVRPAKALMRTWLEHFWTLVSDRDFQAGPCQDTLHQIFLHQAILSAMVVQTLDGDRIRLLPPDYSYPLHFQNDIPQERKAQTLNNLVLAVYEDVLSMDTIGINEPLRSWLGRRTV